MIEVRGLRVELSGNVVLTGIDAKFERKHIVLGPNGSGKTTLFKAISGLAPYKGRVLIDGKPLEEVSGRRGLLGVNFPEVYMLASVSALEVARLYSDIMGVDLDAALTYLEELGVSKHLLSRRKLWELSAGTLKAFTTVLALTSGASNVLLDEPFEQLDPAKKVWLTRKLAALGGTLVMNTHETWILQVFPDWLVHLAFEGRLYGPVKASLLASTRIVRGEDEQAVLRMSIAGAVYSFVVGGQRGESITELLSLDRVYELLARGFVREAPQGGGVA